MLAVWYEKGHFSLRSDIPMPEVREGEARVRILASAICGTDLELKRGYYPFVGIPGHEFVGVVEQAPSCDYLVGQRVVANITISCGKCRACRYKREKHCENRSVLGLIAKNGTFAQYCTIPCGNLIPVPDSLPDDIAVFSEPVAAALRITEQVPIAPADKVLVIGAGRLGQLVARVLHLCGCDLAVAVRHHRQRKLLKTEGIQCVDGNNLPQKCFDIVVDTSGNRNGIAAAGSAVRAGGIIVMKSTYSGKTELDFSSLVVNEVTLVGSRCGPMEKAVQTLADGVIDPRPLIDGIFPLKRAEKALQQAGEPGRLKVLLQCAGS